MLSVAVFKSLLCLCGANNPAWRHEHEIILWSNDNLFVFIVVPVSSHLRLKSTKILSSHVLTV